jgi:hypothetical protein
VKMESRDELGRKGLRLLFAAARQVMETSRH